MQDNYFMNSALELIENIKDLSFDTLLLRSYLSAKDLLIDVLGKNGDKTFHHSYISGS